jgi:UDP-N-acetylglucosamine 2-epimerase (non-hydrolysing)
MRTVLAVIGTRPEAIKMAPVVGALKRAEWCRCVVVASAQHRQLLDQVLELFGIKVDEDLDLMQEGQSLAELTSRLFTALDQVLEGHSPDMVLAQGDTTTAMASAVVAFYRQIPFAHVEAGLRTGNLYNPFPEEFNRVVAGRVATLHFAPTEGARLALQLEGVRKEQILVTGNTIVDALLSIASRPLRMPVDIPNAERAILLTAHRRESFGQPIASIFKAVARLVDDFPDLHVIYPVHPNPNVRDAAISMLRGNDRVHLLAPLDYSGFVACLKRCDLVLTDSGGIQEEAPALGKPVLVLRNETERPEGIEAGVAKLVGTNEQAIYTAARTLLTDQASYAAMARAMSPYGDGQAAARIVESLAKYFNAMPTRAVA